MLWLCKRKVFPALFFTLGTIVLITFSSTPVPYTLISHLESQYKPLAFAPDNVKAIVVLGGGISGNKDYPPNTRLNSSSLSRLVEGIRLYKQLTYQGNYPQLILSGGRVFNAPSEAGKMRNTALMLGVDAHDIHIEDGSKDTHQEVNYIKPLMGDAPFILVTSAFHMPRAMALFKKQGLNPIAAPTQFLSFSNVYSPKSNVGNASALVVSDLAIHEYFGLLWAKIQKQI